MKTFQELKKITKHLPADLPAIKVALTGDTATQFLATEASFAELNILAYEGDLLHIYPRLWC